MKIQKKEEQEQEQDGVTTTVNNKENRTNNLQKNAKSQEIKQGKARVEKKDEERKERVAEM